MKYRIVNENFKSNYGANLLKTRGITDLESFINPKREFLQDPKNLDNIHAGALLLLKVLKENGKILIVVDSDADGFTSAAIMYQYIKKIYPEADIEYSLHEEKQHGLEDHVDIIMDSDKVYGLIILPDSSSNDIEYHDSLARINVPCLVLDHHLTDNKISLNATVINNQLSKNYSNKELTGAGIVYQFCRYLDSILNVDFAEEYIDLAALGIIGDMGSVVNLENRYIIKTGLENIKNFFFSSLLEKQSFSTKGKVNPTTISFYITPLINAMIRAGTMEEKTRMFEAFIDGKRKIPSGKRGAKGKMEYAAIESVRECVNARSRQNRILDEVVLRLEDKILKHGLLENKILFVRLDNEDDFPAVLNGLTAMKLAEKFKKPTIVARLNNEGYIRGSARAVNDSPLPNLKSFFSESGFFEYALGHEGAHGISIANENLNSFHQWANKELETVDFGEGTFNVNFIRSASDSDLKSLILEMGNYEDLYGQQNPEALIYIHDINLNIDAGDLQIMGTRQDTIKFVKFEITYIKFFAKDFIKELQSYNHAKINLIGKMQKNEWNGFTKPQILIEDYEIIDNTLEF